MGWVTPLGATIDQVWQNLLAGRSGVDRITIFDPTNFPTQIAAEVKNWSIAESGEDPKEWAKVGRHTRFAVAAAKMAMRDSGLEVGVQPSGCQPSDRNGGASQANACTPAVDPLRFGVYLGSGEGHQDFYSFSDMIIAALDGDKFDVAKFTQAGLERLDPVLEMEQEPNMPAGHIAALFNAQGPNANCLTACAASSQAVGEAVEMIRRGDVDVMISGGTHSMIHPFGVTGFNLLTALSTRNAEPQRASRPFDKDRDGFVLGEGASMLIVEELEHAKRRGATIYAEIVGYGSTADAYRVTDSHPEGRGAAACMRLALEDARIHAEQVGYINAHGTSTDVNDRVETLAIKTVFGEHARGIPVSSTKSMMGHLIAAAGATELIISILALRDGMLPPTINYDTPDPDCDLDYVPNQAREKKIDYALTNSFGFGGQNIALLVGKV
jgi:3-oxoacyl-[acyl-carrier-protein] synthase II